MNSAEVNYETISALVHLACTRINIVLPFLFCLFNTFQESYASAFRFEPNFRFLLRIRDLYWIFFVIFAVEFFCI